MANRAPVAKELQDVVAHHMALGAVQLETGRLTLPGLTGGGGPKLTDIGDTAREALGEMRGLIGVLRAGADTGPGAAEESPASTGWRNSSR
ncbi:histidine kinase dimerization/phosphoacceptor domain-containing protein [Streptomyces sp. NPDC005917]|uniref:histidine kinase dimerization/phosphoacceptor domain-containing protein n=1 Tax=unclassified Streptomyces TaxID=2593676 RepID=UPI0034036D10